MLLVPTVEWKVTAYADPRVSAVYIIPGAAAITRLISNGPYTACPALCTSDVKLKKLSRMLMQTGRIFVLDIAMDSSLCFNVREFYVKPVFPSSSSA